MMYHRLTDLLKEVDLNNITVFKQGGIIHEVSEIARGIIICFIYVMLNNYRRYDRNSILLFITMRYFINHQP